MKAKILSLCLLVALIVWLSHKPMKKQVLQPYKSVQAPNLGGTYVDIEHSLNEMNITTQEVSAETLMLKSLPIAPIEPEITDQILDTAEVRCSNTN